MVERHKQQLPHQPIASDKTDVWVFDLDNTLYPAGNNLFAQIDIKLRDYVAECLSIGPQEARKIQKKYFMEYGTTLSGMMKHHNVDPDHFLDYVHDIDFSPIKKSPDLINALASLEGRKLIYTNADAAYSAKVLARLGITEHIESIFDINAAELLPKPAILSYEKFLRDHDVDPNRAVMVEDMAKNLIPAKELGMGTIWVNTGSVWGEADHHPDFVDVETHDLATWLSEHVKQLEK